ncbi:anhydro-N-acetylmuramic acid kinase [Rapidithrix thailandica]|uniref:Anhydro-N-acetylmuramic acid kinase n=1 Tax=Rapidithrix thailandica TaxID=413964 RepID=A0AAW9S2V9_9BACT
MEKINVIGVMSGTSLDGLDMAYCNFWKEYDQWHFELLHTQEIPYEASWQQRLAHVEKQSALDLAQTDVDLGKWMGEQVHQFMQQYQLQPHFIASHGHTIFHQPEKGLTYQIGSGAHMAAICNSPVVNDFRTMDVALGGQGAPLVPIGDQLLFPEYNYCLNLGGIANISAKIADQQIAFDISPCNQVLNTLAEQSGKMYDKNGELASTGQFVPSLFDELNKLDYYQLPFPKSLGKEWVVAQVYPLLTQYTQLRTVDILCTFCHHIAFQIQQSIEQMQLNKNIQGQMLVTGGGAFNSFLLQQIQEYCKEVKVIVPSQSIIAFKEALIFAFLGVLRWHQAPNCLRSVTGARHNNCGGAIYWTK